MSHTYFISDIHLSFKENDFELEKRRKLMNFLEFVHRDDEASALFLVGDIFDFWFEWYHVVPKYWFPVMFRFRQLVERGVQVNFIAGNHDFYTGQYLTKEIGIRCFDDHCDTEILGKRFFIAHGDGLAKEDRGYRFLKRVIRNRFSIFLFKTFIPPDVGMQLAKWSSQGSRRLVRIEKPSWAVQYHSFAREKFKQGCDYVVMGHIHFPIHETEEDGKTFMICGDWMTLFTYGKFDGRQLSLNHWENTLNEEIKN